MTLTTALSRGASPHHRHVAAHGAAPARPVHDDSADARTPPLKQPALYFMTPADTRGCCNLLADCLSPVTETSRHIAIKAQSFQLINASSHAIDVPIDRIDRCHALIGSGWLSAFSLVQALAILIRRHASADESLELELEGIWQHGAVLADTAELLSRATGRGPSLRSWLCGWLVAACEIDGRMRLRLAEPRATTDDRQRARSATVDRLRHVIGGLGADKHLPFPDPGGHPHGPWPIISSAARLIGAGSRLPLLADTILETSPASWPISLRRSLAEKIAQQLTVSQRFSAQAWEKAATATCELSEA
jgi:hypothetical protein